MMPPRGILERARPEAEGLGGVDGGSGERHG